MGARIPTGLVGAALAATLAACGAMGAVDAPVTQATADLSWRDHVLAVVRPVADRRLSANDAPGSPFLALGLDALGRASADARYAAAATAAGSAGPATAPMNREAACDRNACRADDLLSAWALWAGPGAGESASTGLVALDLPFRRMAQILFDREALLFRADAGSVAQDRFDAHLNARAFAALTRMIDTLPAEDPARLEYVALYREMARPIVRLQGADGWWRETLGDETMSVDRSASALYVYGLTWGLNTGMLSFNEGEAAALRGWAALHSTEGLAALRADDQGMGALLLASAQLAERRW